MFESRGYQKVDFNDRPDIFIVNTCSVTENADKKCRKIVREARAISPEAYVALVGCYAQLKPEEIAAIPGVDAVLGAAEKFRLLDLLDNFERKPVAEVFASEIKEVRQFNHSYSIHDRTRTFLKVQDGCNYNCTFCTIPLARGKSRSDSMESIIREAREIAETEVKEIVLTGVNTGDFGILNGQRKESFLELIRELDKIDGIERFRISSIEPNLLKDDIIHFVAGSEHFVPHFHIPLQSGSDFILERMKRRYRTDLYTNRIRMIRKLMPTACIGVDVIVGFPGETEEEFLKTYNYLNELDISYLHVFTYSERPNTAALQLDGPVPLKDRQKRSRMLRILSEKKRRSFYEMNIGNQSTVLFENDVENGLMHGFTDNYIRVAAKFDPLYINEIKKIRLISIAEHGHMDVEEIEEPANEVLS